VSVLAACVVFGSGLAAFAGAWWAMARADRRDTAAGPRQAPGDRYVAWPDQDASAPPAPVDHPEPAPAIPGRMSLEDSTAVVRAALRLTRDAAERREAGR
jgi:hypothetical protein